MTTTYQTKPCKRCEGKGRLAHFGHVNNGVCLDCKGAGFKYVTRKANFATVLKRERVGSGWGGWQKLDSYWMAEGSTAESIKAKYVAAGWDAEQVHVNVAVADRKIKK